MVAIPPRLRDIISLDRLESALRSAWLPLALLVLALSTVFIFSGDRGHFYRPVEHSWNSSEHMTIVVNFSPEHGFQRFFRRIIEDDGVARYQWYNRFPIGGDLLMKVATLPVSGSPSAQLYAVRILMLLFFAGAAVLAYLSLCRLVPNRWIALTAVLLAFSSYHLLYFNDMVANDGMPDFFGVILAFHGMVVFVQEGRFRQLVVKTCIALLLGWHVLALLLPFVIFGLARDLLRARSAAADSIPPVMSSRLIASTLLRSRCLLLGAVALAFGLSVLTFNFTMEYIALDGETPLTELPSFQSMVTRFGGDDRFNTIQAPYREWPQFVKGQFRSILRMFIPYFLSDSLGYRGDGSTIAGAEVARRLSGSLGYGSDGFPSPMWLSDQGGTLGIILSAACLIGSMFVRPRILFVTLASFGFFWALPMRNSNAVHDFESIYYIGLPLVFFTIVLLLARRLINRDGVIAAAAVAAALIFAVSSLQMSRVGYSAETAQAARDVERDLLAMRETTAGELVTVLRIGGDYEEFSTWWAGHVGVAMNYYLGSSFTRFAHLPAVKGGFVVMRERLDMDALLTPQNQYFFLYDRDSLEAWYEAAYRTAASTEPLAREDFDVYFDDRTVYYLKEPCGRADTATHFFLHVYPFDEEGLPEHRERRGFEVLNFDFEERGLLFGGRCLASVDLPGYAVVKIDTGQVSGGAWRATHVVVSPRLTSKYQSIVSNEPAARSEFDVYIDGGTLHYVKEPCGDGDTAARFFLHVHPIDQNDLPEGRRQHGFENLDFDFGERGLSFGGKCLVSVDLPEYGIRRITTGQFDGGGRVWEVEFAPDARE